MLCKNGENCKTRDENCCTKSICKVPNGQARFGEDQTKFLQFEMVPKVLPTGVLFENDNDVLAAELPAKIKPEERKLELIWRNIILMGGLHIAAVYGVYLMFTSAKIQTSLWAFLMYQCGGLGITAGVHRLWAHRAYKAKWPLAVMLAFFNAIAFQDPIAHWARDHRVHHKYSETDADPHNANRGFFFCHVGWLFCRKHQEVKEKGKDIYVADLHSDPVVMFQKKYYNIIMPFCCFIMPTVVPMIFWNETFANALFSNLLRYAWTLNATWLVNSAAHYFGSKPYDRFMRPGENKFIAVIAMGEGWHNFHHTFPWDSKSSELGGYAFNSTNLFLDLMAKIGWAYDFKTVSKEIIRKRALKTGDGSHAIWGWGDKDQSSEEMADALILHKEDS